MRMEYFWATRRGQQKLKHPPYTTTPSYICPIQLTPTLSIIWRIHQKHILRIFKCIQPPYSVAWEPQPWCLYINPWNEVPNNRTSGRCSKQILHNKTLHIQNHTLKHNKVEGAMRPTTMSLKVSSNITYNRQSLGNKKNWRCAHMCHTTYYT